MCRTTLHSPSRHFSDSCSDSDKVMAAESSLRVPYSRCPLKKRPIINYQDLNESPDGVSGGCVGPENLSTKPEDLRLKCEPPMHPTTVTVTSSEITLDENRLQPKTPATLLRRYLQSRPFSPQTFEKLTSEDRLEPIHSGKPLACFRSDSLLAPYVPTPPHYPHYLYEYLSSTEPYSDCQHLRTSPEKTYNSCSFNSSLHYSDRALRPQPFSLPNSPVTSSHSYPTYRDASMRTPSPPLTPEDLSSPGSVASSGCCSIGSTGYTGTNRRQRYQCSLCFKLYSTHSGLSKHQRSHCTDREDNSLTEKCFGCKSCEKVYVTSGALKMHIRTHTLPCKCFICGKCFSRPWLLQGHIRTHTGEKPFSCPLCERAFADRSNLRAHLQTHSELKKYSCSNCGKSFSRMSLLTKHLGCGCPGPRLSLRDLNMIS